MKVKNCVSTFQVILRMQYVKILKNYKSLLIFKGGTGFHSRYAKLKKYYSEILSSEIISNMEQILTKHAETNTTFIWSQFNKNVTFQLSCY